MTAPLKSIVLIEDDHDTRVVLRQALENDGYFVFSATDGRSGLELIRRIKPPCLILLDILMPIMDGKAFLEALDEDPTLHMIPVVLVSAYPDRAKALVAKAFVQKPVDIDALLDVVKEHCRKE